MEFIETAAGVYILIYVSMHLSGFEMPTSADENVDGRRIDLFTSLFVVCVQKRFLYSFSGTACRIHKHTHTSDYVAFQGQ